MKAKKARAIANGGRHLKQVAALPFRLDAAGNLELLLITSRGTKRFIIPKGRKMNKLPDPKAAAEEASQEAGVLGTVAKGSIGSHLYWKRVKKAFIPVTVDIYPLEVEGGREVWRERQQRQRVWVSVNQAIALIDEPQLVLLLRDAAAALRSRVTS